MLVATAPPNPFDVIHSLQLLGVVHPASHRFIIISEEIMETMRRDNQPHTHFILRPLIPDLRQPPPPQAPRTDTAVGQSSLPCAS